MPRKKIRQHLHHCAKSLSCVTGVVFIWYGIGIFIDYLAEAWFQGRELWFGCAVVIIGVIILYLPDQDLDELG